MKTKALLFLITLLGTVLLTTSCSKDDDSTISVKSISLDKTTLVLAVGTTEILTASLSPTDASNKSLTWLSSNETVATVSNGTVTAIGGGTATITARADDGAHTATCSVTVTKNFPDDNFRKVLVESYGLVEVNGDISLNNATNQSKFSTLTEITCSDKKIVSLQGIEYFTVLSDLYCNKNQIVELDISKNTALIFLRCDDNQLTGLDVSKNTALTSLICKNNRLTALDVSKNTVLTTLGCYDNQLATLDVSKNTALTTLWCDDNKLTTLDISMLPTFVNTANSISCGAQQNNVNLTLVLTQAQFNGAWSRNKNFDANANVTTSIVQL